MHCLEVIQARNERAAGREMGHAVNDGNQKKANNILGTAQVTDAFVDGYARAREEQ